MSMLDWPRDCGGDADSFIGGKVLKEVAVGVLRALGNPNAPVVVEEWGDFQCPFCRAFALGAERQLRDTLVASGEVRFVWHNFAFLGPESVWAAEAADCAGDEDAFWAYHDKLFAEQDGENQGKFVKPNLITFAGELSLDVARFNTCLSRNQYLARIEAERAEGLELGVDSTPTFFINGYKLTGVPTFHHLQQIISAQAPAA